jgi:predicted SnoaL-like aldol condensation-catalyzing enzyme
MHRILTEGNLVLTASEGSVTGAHSSLFDLFRVAIDKLVEHWDTTEVVPPRNEYKNDNGKC